MLTTTAERLLSKPIAAPAPSSLAALAHQLLGSGATKRIDSIPSSFPFYSPRRLPNLWGLFCLKILCSLIGSYFLALSSEMPSSSSNPSWPTFTASIDCFELKDLPRLPLLLGRTRLRANRSKVVVPGFLKCHCVELFICSPNRIYGYSCWHGRQPGKRIPFCY